MSEEVPIELYRKENGEFVKYVRYDDYKKLKKIIKEVREWANKTIFYFDFEEKITKHAFDLLYTKQGQELLEILDKENKI